MSDLGTTIFVPAGHAAYIYPVNEPLETALNYVRRLIDNDEIQVSPAGLVLPDLTPIEYDEPEDG